jgi:hypothetical protein
MGQESLTRFDQPKRKTNKTKVSGGKQTATKIKLSQTTKKPANTTPSGASEKKPAITRKPIIITKMTKNSIFHLITVFFRVTKECLTR